MNDSTIKHEGTVVAVSEGRLRVAISRQSACAACHAASHCAAAEGRQFNIDVSRQDATAFQVGQRVQVVETRQVAVRALLWAFVVPLVLMLTAMAATIAITGSEAAGAIAALVSLVVSFGMLRLLRGRLERCLVFTVTSVT